MVHSNPMTVVWCSAQKKPSSEKKGGKHVKIERTTDGESHKCKNAKSENSMKSVFVYTHNENGSK